MIISQFNNSLNQRFWTPLKGLANKIVNSLAAILIISGVILPFAKVNIAFAAPTNLVNPDLEQVTNNVPNCFNQAGWGQHNVTWAITNDAHSGTKAQSVTINNYSSGDRKLMMAENTTCAPTVTPGNTYKLSAWYKSTAAQNSLTVFRHSGAGWTYWTDLTTLPAVAVWSQGQGTTPVVPSGTDQIAFGISLSGNGTLITDDYSFSQTGTTTPPPSELTTNGGLENGSNPPTGWMLAGWGDATVNGIITNAAHGGNQAYSLTLSGRTQGDYKLIPTQAASPAVQPGTVYNLSVWYESTTNANSVTIFAHTSSGWGYWTDVQTLPAAAGWTQAQVKTPTIPAGIDAIAWGVSIAGNGTLVTDDYSTSKFGDVTPPPPNGDPSTDGQWTVLNYQMPIRAMHATLLKNGKVLLVAGSGNDLSNFQSGSFKASVWDPVSGTFNTLNVPKDMFCSGHVTLPDGRVLIQGGTKSYPSKPGGGDYGGLKDSWIFDPDTNTFTPINLANEGHWYPTLTELGNGDVWMAGGLKEDTSGAVNTEYFSSTTNQWLPTAQVPIPQTWKFWGLYPSMILLQDGRLFYSGGHVFGNGLPGSGASLYNPSTGSITDVLGLRQKDMRDQSGSVLLPPAQNQKVLITGGGNVTTTNPAINLTDIIDLKQANPAYQPGPDLPGDGKMYVNTTILPDRTVLISNGSKLNRDNSTNVLTAALYDPAANTMRSIPADPIGRNYHSTSLLLPDGRVAVFGSNPGDGSFELRISIYTPSYLFRTARPSDTNVPAQATYNQQLSFNYSDPNKTVKWAQLTRPMSVTHQMDSNMRLVDLPFTVQNGVVTVTMPANPNLLPPGPYMLTITDSDNIPSIASWVMVH
ncbi:MAG TPA: galactose oxidase-like domain-containing protein [Candidatus Saccharimonadales bacterium]|nr:galactose oxidase-like domain-containing protein [Candidatus Saccharimonadales bacterium]